MSVSVLYVKKALCQIHLKEVTLVNNKKSLLKCLSSDLFPLISETVETDFNMIFFGRKRMSQGVTMATLI